MPKAPLDLGDMEIPDDPTENTPFLLSTGAAMTKNKLYSSLDDDQDSEPAGRLHVMLKTLVDSNFYELLMGVFILVDLVITYMEIDHHEKLSEGQWMIVSLVVLLVFTADVLIKVFVYTLPVYIKSDWNKFDFIVTLVACSELIVSFCLMGSRVGRAWRKFVSGDLINCIRIVRVLRLARIFPDLANLLESFRESLMALGWIFVFGWMLFFISACCATVFIGRRDQLPSENVDDIRDLREHFNTIAHSMFTLFEIMTLEGWTDYCRPLLVRRPQIVLAILGFIFMANFFLLNLFTAVVVQKMLSATSKAQEEADLQAQQMKAKLIDELYKELCRLNEKRDLMTKEDLHNWMSHRGVADKMDKLGWKKFYMSSMFTLCDHDNNGEVSLINLRRIWLDCMQPLTTSNYVQFQMNVARRMEYVDLLTARMVLNLQSYAGESMCPLEDDVKPYITRMSTGFDESPRWPSQGPLVTATQPHAGDLTQSRWPAMGSRQ